jgi:hypothetical protein
MTVATMLAHPAVDDSCTKWGLHVAVCMSEWCPVLDSGLRRAKVST